MIVDIHAHVGHHPIHDFRQEPEEVLSVMDRFGIDRTFVMPFPSMKVKKVNDAVAEAVSRYPDRLIGFGCIDPSANDAADEVERCVNIGLKGVMLDPEFHSLFRRINPWNAFKNEMEPGVERLLVPCLEKRLPVLLNTPNIEVGDGARRGMPYFHVLNEMVSKFPEVRFIVNDFWPRVYELMNVHPNIIIDTGGRNGISLGLMNAVKEAGPTRICFGSESPQNHPAIGIKDIRYIKLDPLYKELILGKNAERIFKDLF